MLNYTDIIRKTITAVPDPAAQPLWDPGYDFPDGTCAWIHPDKCTILFLNMQDVETYGLNPKVTGRAEWISKQFRASLLIKPEDLVPEKHVLGGKLRKLCFNHTVGTPEIIDTVPISDKFVKRYSYKHSLLYQSMENPYGYFFTTDNGTPYAFALPCRIPLACASDWRV